MNEAELTDTYARFGPLVRVRCRRIVRDHAAAEDALQETFVRVWRFGDAFLAAESRLGWLYRVADRCCFDQLQRRRSRGETELSEAHPAPAGSAAQTFEDREVVMSFLDRFDERVQQVAVLYYLDEMTQDEIAQATGWSRQTVNKKLQLLRDRAGALRHVYGEGGAP